jgi:hypothetical protein
MVSSEPVPNVEAFFQSYRTAFERSDARAITDLFAYPSHVTSDTGEIGLLPIVAEDQWIGQIEGLLGMYSRIGVASALVLELGVTPLSPRLYQASVHWAIHDAAGDMLYRFEATYTLAEIDGALRITALAHNEVPQLRACLARQQSHG